MKVKSKKKNYIELYGVIGEFEIPNNKYTVKYFSTFANSREKNSGPYQLLQELKPMRERVKATEMKDIISLLQRELNDSRVANELVPYLIGAGKNSVGFFPAILGALLPKDFIMTGNPPYPKAEENKNGNLVLNYEDKWIVEQLNDEQGEVTPLGILKVDSYETDIIVLDGQHRTNAFRIVSNTFQDTTNTIYESFYENIKTPEKFTADLPVTLIWFESTSEEIDPRLISRKLFVDVNNTARAVSKSRTILLNDFDPSAILARLWYTFIARENSFNSNEISLLHSGFDLDSDLKKSSPNLFTLTTPEIIYDSFEWIFFGSKINNELDRYQVKRLPSSFTDTSTCARIIPKFRKQVSIELDENDNYRKYFDINSSFESIENEFNELITDSLNALYNKFNLLRIHFDACKEMSNNRESNWSSPTKRDVWDKVFCGGEGLYYSYKNIPSSKIQSNQPLRDIIKTIDDIESEFSRIRGDKIKGADEKRVNDAFRSFRTKAFQIGYLMAFYQYFWEHYTEYTKDTISKAIDTFLVKINNISAIGWIYILTELRENIIKGIDPKKWPTYHKIILRIVQDEGEYFDNNSNKNNSPEAWIYYNQLDKKYKGWIDSNDVAEENITKDDLNDLIIDWDEKAREFVDELFSNCQIEIMDRINWKELSHAFISNKLSHAVMENDNEE